MQIKCTQCGADVTVQQDATFIDCPYCGSALFLDKKKVVFHYVINSNFKPNEAEGNLKRWMAGNHTVKDLDKKCTITKTDFYYFPVWYFKTKDASGDKISIQPAATTSVSEIKKIPIPAGSLKFYEKELSAQWTLFADHYLDDRGTLSFRRADTETITVLAAQEDEATHIRIYIQNK